MEPEKFVRRGAPATDSVMFVNALVGATVPVARVRCKRRLRNGLGNVRT